MQWVAPKNSAPCVNENGFALKDSLATVLNFKGPAPKENGCDVLSAACLEEGTLKEVVGIGDEDEEEENEEEDEGFLSQSSRWN